MGETLFVSRGRGAVCVLCHQVAGLMRNSRGMFGPPSPELVSRLLPGQLRPGVVDYELSAARCADASTIAFTTYNQLSDAHEGKPVLPPDDVEDLRPLTCRR